MCHTLEKEKQDWSQIARIYIGIGRVDNLISTLNLELGINSITQCGIDIRGRISSDQVSG